MPGGFGGSQNAVGRPSALALCAAASGAAAAAFALWYVWPRRPKASREVALSAVKRLQEELVAVYADVVGTISQAGVPRDLANATAGRPSPSDPAAAGGVGDSNVTKRDDPAEKMRQAVEQPLLLQAALTEAAQRSAALLFAGATPEDLQAELERHADEPEVQSGNEVMTAVHQECFRGQLADNVPAVEAACAVWDKDSVLETLRALGRAKLDALEVATAAATQPVVSTTSGAPLVGAKGAVVALRACADAEDAVWRRLWPSDHDWRRRCFPTALERWTSSDRRGFGQRRQAIERELETEAKARALRPGRRKS